MPWVTRVLSNVAQTPQHTQKESAFIKEVILSNWPVSKLLQILPPKPPSLLSQPGELNQNRPLISHPMFLKNCPRRVQLVYFSSVGSESIGLTGCLLSVNLTKCIPRSFPLTWSPKCLLCSWPQSKHAVEEGDCYPNQPRLTESKRCGWDQNQKNQLVKANSNQGILITSYHSVLTAKVPFVLL